ncbi:MAG: hypothetical protein ACYTGG_09140 [Planctomycetota bacterium]|jgi:hypothetical protein
MRARTSLAGLIVVAASSAALAQEAVDPQHPLDQTVDDRGGLARSLREIEPGLRVPSGFEQVYRVPGRDDLLMRVNGGLYAVFPVSKYEMSRRGVVALIPDDTVFHIGAPGTARLRSVAADQSPAPAPPGASSAPAGIARTAPWNGRLQRPVHRAPGLATRTRTVANDETYRVRRVRQLLRQAAAAELALMRDGS